MPKYNPTSLLAQETSQKVSEPPPLKYKRNLEHIHETRHKKSKHNHPVSKHGPKQERRAPNNETRPAEK